ncbi:MAG TPA: hypothetical protein VHB98_23850, partial [Chloroflexota bacterium]|nr:hypothetical protein [Chloroflexota bacterium]
TMNLPTTSTRRAPDTVTEEATRDGLRRAHEAGAAYQRAVDYFITHVAHWSASPRHDKINGKRYEHAVEVTFADVEIATGRK